MYDSIRDIYRLNGLIYSTQKSFSILCKSSSVGNLPNRVQHRLFQSTKQFLFMYGLFFQSGPWIYR